ncbi:hypothetical protein HNQ41_001102 [Texcoconibacillus texcoconensis]|uniref:Uncharacterized protein n=1 Tax=Texcoconibacillus texcoconensis TaxID=1095777 RepID=A0A840QNJ2_9BACI|nr:hypothetical protein [Texcoconibacillus texcoconensis]
MVDYVRRFLIVGTLASSIAVLFFVARWTLA